TPAKPLPSRAHLFSIARRVLPPSPTVLPSPATPPSFLPSKQFSAQPRARRHLRIVIQPFSQPQRSVRPSSRAFLSPPALECLTTAIPERSVRPPATALFFGQLPSWVWPHRR